MRGRLRLCLGLLAASSCADVDSTWLREEVAWAGLQGVTVEDAGAPPSSVVSGRDTVAPALHYEGKADAGAATAAEEAKPDQDVATALEDCSLRVSWGAVSASAPDCTSFSAAFDTRAALWTGGRLSFIGATWSAQGDRLERQRVCTGGASEQWRFRETLVFPSALPGGRCWDEPVTAAYQYTECPELNSGWPCNEPYACTFQVAVTFTPASVVNTEALGEPEPNCEELKPLGAACSRRLDCADGSFCSRQLDDKTCMDLGAGTCQPAPVYECLTNDPAGCTCDGQPIETERVCLCDDGPPIELPGLNACLVRMDGVTAWPCP